MVLGDDGRYPGAWQFTISALQVVDPVRETTRVSFRTQEQKMMTANTDLFILHLFDEPANTDSLF
jgi:hypothetical protein